MGEQGGHRAYTRGAIRQNVARPSGVVQETAELIRYALRGVEHVCREGYRYQKAGVILPALVLVHQVQTHLCDQHDGERSQKLRAAIDMINTK